MPFIALTCPQCAAPLPRQARWRTVTCSYCGAVVTRSGDELVQAADFRAAWQRAQAGLDTAARLIPVGGRRYRLLHPLGAGSHSEVWLAERLALHPERVTLKLARPDCPAGTLAREADLLRRLQALGGPGAAYFSQRLPQPVQYGIADEGPGYEREALALRHPTGFWGSLAECLAPGRPGIDARHIVWIWRRVLDVLAFIHGAGWTHGDLTPEHLLVHPRDHGVLLIGWGQAQAVATPDAIDRDLRQAAWSMRALLAGGDVLQANAGAPGLPATLPSPLAGLLRQASEERGWCAALGAAAFDQGLQSAAREAFGPPQFIPFNPVAPHATAF